MQMHAVRRVGTRGMTEDRDPEEILVATQRAPDTGELVA